ncbi:hypothetical protein GCM10009115_34720 [Sphingopyxis soli]|uniref:Uncharacterized protein n=1 Tax=Sphingopyxis soli TaxID=592051 RepID=A0ABN1MCT9_9SPHN
MWSFEAEAFSTIFFVSYMAAPPTAGFLAAAVPAAMVMLAAAIESAMREMDIGRSFANRPWGKGTNPVYVPLAVAATCPFGRGMHQRADCARIGQAE